VTPTRLSRAEQQAATRERLLAAAEQAFSRLGYGGASADLIAAEAGYSKGAFYSNFPNKEAILLELLRRYSERDMADLKRCVGLEPDDLRAAVTDWLNTAFVNSDCPELATELQLHARRSPEFAEQYYALQRKQIDALAQILRGYFGKLSVALPIDARDLAASMMALANGIRLQRPADQPDEPSSAGQVVDAILGILTASPAVGQL
jgi:AcrR family transcriptional regulator